ncbi:MAG: coiled-coil domain-containing protein, partial [Actinomycetota bacterium]
MLAIGALLLTLVPLAALAEPSSDEVEDDIERAQQRLDEIDEELAQHLESYNQAQVELEEAQGRLDATREELAELEQRSEELLGVVEDHVRTLHKVGPTLELYAVIMTADPTEAGTRATTLRRILDGRQADLESLTAATDTIDALESRLADERERAEAATEAAEEEQEDIEAAHARVEDEIAELHEVLEETIEREEEQARREQERRERQEQREQQAEQQASSNDAGSSSS